MQPPWCRIPAIAWSTEMQFPIFPCFISCTLSLWRRVGQFKFVGLQSEWALSMCLFNVIQKGRRFMFVDQLHYVSSINFQWADYHAFMFGGGKQTKYPPIIVHGSTDYDPIDSALYNFVKARFRHELKAYNITGESCPVLVSRPAEMPSPISYKITPKGHRTDPKHMH